MTKFMTQDSNHLIRLTLLNQSVVDDNVLLPGESKEIGIAVGTALATVDNVQFLKGEIQLASQVLDTSLELTRLQGRQLVEQRQDSNRVNRDSKDLHEDTKEPQVVEERVTGNLDDLEHRADNRSSQNNSEHLTLEHIRNPELQRLLVETEFLLEDESAVVRGWQRQDRADDIEPKDKDQCLRDFTLEPRREILSQQGAAEGPELRKEIAIDKRQILKLTVETCDEAELGFGATVCL